MSARVLCSRAAPFRGCTWPALLLQGECRASAAPKLRPPFCLASIWPHERGHQVGMAKSLFVHLAPANWSTFGAHSARPLASICSLTSAAPNELLSETLSSALQ